MRAQPLADRLEGRPGVRRRLVEYRLAQAYLLVRVDGFDLDPDVIVAARRNAGQSRVAGRVTFAVTDASGPGMTGRYDLATIFEGLHDMSRPVDALRAARGMLGQTGSVIEDECTASATELERYHYRWSVMSCLQSVMGGRSASSRMCDRSGTVATRMGLAV